MAVQRRIDQLAKTYKVTATKSGRSLNELRHLVAGVGNNPENLPTLFSDPDFLKLIRHPARAALELGLWDERLGHESSYVEVLPGKRRLIVRNPLTQRVESWARPFVDEVSYHFGKPTQHKSTFTVDRQAATASILQAFENPVGVVKSAKRFFLYAKFERPLGELKNGGGPTNFLCVQCDRERMPNAARYHTRLHGYPYSEAVVVSDLNAVPDLQALL